MKIGKKFNTFTFKEYFSYIENHKKYTDFNTLGLYRSLRENKKLTLEEKIKVREYAHTFFKKFFDFLQVKDPYTFVEVSKLGLELIKGEQQIENEVKVNQQKILAKKRIKHRNFGIYSRHDGTRIQYVDSYMKKRTAYGSAMTFASDKYKMLGTHKGLKSAMQEVEKRNLKNTIRKELETEYNYQDGFSN